MARVYPGERRLRESSFALYAQPAGTADTVFVRRKVGEPCDYQHAASRKTQLQRLRFAKAAKDYAKLSFWQKKGWDKKLEFI